LVKKQVYVAFDFDDRDVKGSLVEQSKRPDCPFELIDRSIIKPFTAEWPAEARRLISGSECVIVLCGLQTHQADGVAVEVQVAQQTGKPYFLLQATRGGTPTRPRHARESDKIWHFRWATVTTLLAGGTPPPDAALP
jgi:hypothetical protein